MLGSPEFASYVTARHAQNYAEAVMEGGEHRFNINDNLVELG